MGASMSIDANILMDGRNKNTILLTIKCMPADKLNNAKNLTVLIFIQNKINVNQLISSSRSSQRTEAPASTGPRPTNQSF